MSRKSKIILCIALAMCLLGGLMAGLVQTSFGQVTVTDVVIETDSGRFTGYLPVPKTATAQTPAPAIVTSHGHLDHREMQDLNYVELSRRGILASAGALFPILVFPFVPILSIVAVTAVKLYRRTGNAYLPGILNALVVTMITIAGTSFSHPY